jgi:hypothetical protein
MNRQGVPCFIGDFMKKFIFVAATMIAIATAANADCAAELQAIMQSHATAGPYHVTMEQTTADKTRKIEADVILPSSFHMKMPEMETIMLKQGTWMKMGGKWQVMPGVASGALAKAVSTGMEKGMANVKNLQCLGTQSVEGKTYKAYDFDSSGEAMGIKATSHITLYRGDNGLPAIMIVEGEAMGHKSKTVQHVTYDPAITISPPQ